LTPSTNRPRRSTRGEEFSDGEFTVIIDRVRLVDELKGTYGSASRG
jgi:hypothetical protein